MLSKATNTLVIAVRVLNIFIFKRGDYGRDWLNHFVSFSRRYAAKDSLGRPSFKR